MISAVILTKNEEKNIEKCIKSVKWCDEIVIVDDYSTDNTVETAKKFRAKVYKQSLSLRDKRHLNKDFASQRNFGLSKAKNEWVLFVDADEIVTEKLREEILSKTEKTHYSGFYLKRGDIFLGREVKYGETGNVKLLRLARKNSGKWKRKIHETWNITGRIGELKNELIHNHDESLSKFVEKINQYSTIHASENSREGKISNIFKVVFYPIAKFFDNYFLKLGFLDGIEGFIMAVMMSFHSFLAWSKLWMD